MIIIIILNKFYSFQWKQIRKVEGFSSFLSFFNFNSSISLSTLLLRNFSQSCMGQHWGQLRFAVIAIVGRNKSFTPACRYKSQIFLHKFMLRHLLQRIFLLFRLLLFVSPCEEGPPGRISALSTRCLSAGPLQTHIYTHAHTDRGKHTHTDRGTAYRQKYENYLQQKDVAHSRRTVRPERRSLVWQMLCECMYVCGCVCVPYAPCCVCCNTLDKEKTA